MKLNQAGSGEEVGSSMAQGIYRQCVADLKGAARGNGAQGLLSQVTLRNS